MKLKFVSLFLFLFAELTQAFIADSMYFGGFEFSNNLRRGFFALSGGHVQKQELNDMAMAGISVGKRFRLNDHLRINVPVSFDYGKSDEDTFEVALEGGTYVTAARQSSIFQFGTTPELQMPLKVTPEARIVISAGAGFHLIKYLEDEIEIGQQQFKINDPYLESSFKAGISANAGVGFETVMSRKFGISVMYTFRYWKPVSYKTQRDLFPSGPVDYSQIFFTHQILFCILLNRNTY
jgi:hypothetical protein